MDERQQNPDKEQQNPTARRPVVARLSNYIRKKLTAILPILPIGKGFSHGMPAGNVPMIRWTGTNQMAVALPYGTSIKVFPFVAPRSGNGDEFTFTRAVINFDVRDDQGPVQTFDPPLRLYLPYLQDEEHKLAFGFWDGNKWVEFMEDKHSFTALHYVGSRGFEFWDERDRVWQQLPSEGDDFFKIRFQLVLRTELQSVYDEVISHFAGPDGTLACGFAFVQVASWGDPPIAAGISRTRVIIAGMGAQ